MLAMTSEVDVCSRGGTFPTIFPYILKQLCLLTRGRMDFLNKAGVILLQIKSLKKVYNSGVCQEYYNHLKSVG